MDFSGFISRKWSYIILDQFCNPLEQKINSVPEIFATILRKISFALIFDICYLPQVVLTYRCAYLIHRPDHTSLHIPEDIFKFENHLGEPPIVANINKRLRDAQKVRDLSDDLQMTLNLNKDAGSVLQHQYAEGTDFTLTDLVLFPCMTFLLVGNNP